MENKSNADIVEFWLWWVVMVAFIIAVSTCS